jgi:hypothetical protein
MVETLAQKIAVGDQVRVHFHPPGPWKSFSEGVVKRVDVTTQAGRFFVLEVRNEVLLDQPHRIRPGSQDFVRYESQDDFPGRIEILSTADQDVKREPVPSLAAEAPEAVAQKVYEQQVLQADAGQESESEPTAEAEADAEPHRVHLEHQPVRNQGGLMAALFGRKK